MLPFYIAATFCNLSYEGMITHQLPAFIQIILIVMAGHYIWLAVLYLLAGAYSGKNPWEVLRYYGPAYLTAVGTMSSAADPWLSLWTAPARARSCARIWSASASPCSPTSTSAALS